MTRHKMLTREDTILVKINNTHRCGKSRNTKTMKENKIHAYRYKM